MSGFYVWVFYVFAYEWVFYVFYEWVLWACFTGFIGFYDVLCFMRVLRFMLLSLCFMGVLSSLIRAWFYTAFYACFISVL